MYTVQYTCLYETDQPQRISLLKHWKTESIRKTYEKVLCYVKSNSMHVKILKNVLRYKQFKRMNQSLPLSISKQNVSILSEIK